MVNVSKTQFPPELRKEVWGKFWRIVKTSPSPEALMKNLSVFLSSNEISMLEKRLAILLLLEKGVSYREIGKTIDVSRSTISFVKSNFIRKPKPRNNHNRKFRKSSPYLPSVTRTFQREIAREMKKHKR